jgi:hypothetical protein
VDHDAVVVFVVDDRGGDDYHAALVVGQAHVREEDVVQQADAVAGARLADHTPDELQVRRAILSDSDGPWVLLSGSGAEA